MLDTENYIGLYKDTKTGTWQTTKYADFVDQHLDSMADTQLQDRKPLYCISVPGQSTPDAGTAQDLREAAAQSSGTAQLPSF